MATVVEESQLRAITNIQIDFQIKKKKKKNVCYQVGLLTTDLEFKTCLRKAMKLNQ